MCQYACGGQRVPVEVRGYLEAISHLPSYRSWESRTESTRLGHKLHYPQSHSSWPSAFMFWNRVSRLAWSSPIWLEWQASNLQGCLCKEHQHTSSHPLLYSVKKPNTLSGPPGLSWGFGRKGIYSLQFPGGRNFINNLTKQNRICSPKNWGKQTHLLNLPALHLESRPCLLWTGTIPEAASVLLRASVPTFEQVPCCLWSYDFRESDAISVLRVSRGSSVARVHGG